jgi:hypothetical protein
MSKSPEPRLTHEVMEQYRRDAHALRAKFFRDAVIGMFVWVAGGFRRAAKAPSTVTVAQRAAC